MVKGTSAAEPAAKSSPATQAAARHFRFAAIAAAVMEPLRSAVVSLLGQGIRRPVLRRLDLPVHLSWQRPRPDPPGRGRAGHVRIGDGLPGHPALRQLGHRLDPRPQLRTEDGGRNQPRAAPQDVRTGLGTDRRAQDLAQGPRCHPRPHRSALPEEHPGRRSREADQRGNHLRSRPVPDAHIRAQPDGRSPGVAAGASAVVGPEPLHQAEQHRHLHALRPAHRAERAAGRQPARRGTGDFHAGRSGPAGLRHLVRWPRWAPRQSHQTSPHRSLPI